MHMHLVQCIQQSMHMCSVWNRCLLNVEQFFKTMNRDKVLLNDDQLTIVCEMRALTNEFDSIVVFGCFIL